MKVFGVDLEGVLSSSVMDGKTTTPNNVANLVANKLNATEMGAWVMRGWVPSIISDIPIDKEMQVTAELWLSQNNVPYSNLLLGVDSWLDAIKWTGCSFFITSRPKELTTALGFLPELRMYVVRNRSNAEYEKYIPTDMRLKLIRERVFFVNTFAEITEYENVALR